MVGPPWAAQESSHAPLPLPGIPDEGGERVADLRETTASETGKKTQLRMNRRLSILVALVAIFALAGSASAAPSGSGQLTKVIYSSAPTRAQPDFGPNVKILDPSMSTSQIKTIVDGIASQQISSQFGTGRYAVLFKPGTYGASAAPLNFQIGYYTDVAGLGALPTDVTINGTIDVYNQCFAITLPNGKPGTECTA